jgi:hypothetical protein
MLRTLCFVGFALFAPMCSGLASPQQDRSAASADTHYYMIVFAHERGPLSPRFAHTWATYVKAVKDPGARDDRLADVKTISWLPKSMDIRLLRPEPEEGVNLTLEQSLKYSQSLGVQISMWGPFEIKRELYDRAARQVDRLNKHLVKYKAIDGEFRSSNEAVNCIHAVSDIDTDGGLFETGAANGGPASFLVARHLERWIIHPERTHEWVAEKLGLNRYTIAREKLEPEQGPIVGTK